MKKKQIIWKWAEGKVDPSSEHIELYYGEPGSKPGSWRWVAMVGKPRGGTFPVTWTADNTNPEEAEMIAAASKDLDFYLLEVGGPDPWVYAIYHCGTASNMYSRIHWSHCPDGRSGDRPDEVCPVCGWKLEDAPSGMWCINPDCVVLDDADNYRKE